MQQNPVDATDVCIFRIRPTGDDAPQDFEETHVLEIAWTYNDSRGDYDREIIDFYISNPLTEWDLRRSAHYHVRGSAHLVFITNYASDISILCCRSGIAKA
jgi:hypothetical protein